MLATLKVIFIKLSLKTVVVIFFKKVIFITEFIYKKVIF